MWKRVQGALVAKRRCMPPHVRLAARPWYWHVRGPFGEISISFITDERERERGVTKAGSLSVRQLSTRNRCMLKVRFPKSRPFLFVFISPLTRTQTTHTPHLPSDVADFYSRDRKPVRSLNWQLKALFSRHRRAGSERSGGHGEERSGWKL